MTPERWAQIRQIFDGALERAPKDRAAYLRVVCARDDAMRQEVESLLASHDDASGFLAKPAADLGYTLHYSGDESGEYPAGFRAGPYQLEKRIGRGGMGSVWLATSPQNGGRVAVKLVKRGMDTTEILRRFRMERQVLASLNHPNIARLIDGGSTPEGMPYLAMEYVEGTPIDQFCESRASAITDRLKLFLEVCAAVQFAHQNLVVHRDIKTANILVTQAGVVKLLDFGIAKLLRTDLSTLEIAQTRPELRPMTLDYASPEQVRGEAITTSTDVYSLGVLLYKLLTGRMPYGVTTRSPDAIRKAILETEPRRPSSVILADDTHAIPQATQKIEVAMAETRSLARKRLKKKLSGDLDIIILKALRKEPPKRYLSVEQFSEDVRRYLDGRPVTARIDSRGYRWRKFVRRNIAGVAAAIALVGILLGSTIFFANRQREDKKRFDEATVSLQRQLLRADLEIGSAERVRDAYGLASAIWRSLPEQGESRRDLAEAALRMGDTAADRNAAGKYYGEALAQLEVLAQQAGRHDPSTERALGSVASKIGEIEMERGNLLAALSSFSRALTIAETLGTAEGANDETRLTVADTNAEVGEVLLRNGARAEGVAKLRKALGIYRDLGKDNLAGALEEKLSRQ
ncbi:MAG TPA: serine/threonine-protein kinase [Bryobacteraceae bacterium]|nr:serine/threonine-protein kinase [Bryobacteraceae bacterium]